MATQADTIQPQTQAPAETPANAEAPKKEEPKTVAEDMANRRVFVSEYRDPTEDELAANPDAGPVLVKSAVDAASEYLNACADSLSDFDQFPLAAPGIDDEGNFDPAIYTADMAVMVATLKNRTKVKAIVVAPIPTLDSILSDDAGRDWANKILQKEMNHVAVRALREAEDVSTVIDQIPTTRLGFIESQRADGGIMESFNELYKAVNATLAGKFPVWAKARLIKSELRKAFESKGYALEFYSPLEDYKGQSLFAIALGLAVNTAKRKGMDPTIFERWAATRDSKTYDPAATEDEDEEINLDSLTDALLAESAKSEATTEGATAEQPAGAESETAETVTTETAPADAAPTEAAPAAESPATDAPTA